MDFSCPISVGSTADRTTGGLGAATRCEPSSRLHSLGETRAPARSPTVRGQHSPPTGFDAPHDRTADRHGVASGIGRGITALVTFRDQVLSPTQTPHRNIEALRTFSHEPGRHHETESPFGFRSAPCALLDGTPRTTNGASETRELRTPHELGHRSAGLARCTTQ